MCTDNANHVETQSRIARKLERGSRLKTLIERFLSALLVCVGLGSGSLPCLSQENPQARQASAIALQENPPKLGAQDPQSTTPPKPTTQDAQSTEPQKTEKPPKKDKKPARGAFVVAPLPISSPAIGSGIVPVLGYIFPFSTKDKISRLPRLAQPD